MINEIKNFRIKNKVLVILKSLIIAELGSNPQPEFQESKTTY